MLTFVIYIYTHTHRATLYNRMKLMFVGVQGIGKTSLLNELRKHGKTTIQNKVKGEMFCRHTRSDCPFCC